MATIPRAAKSRQSLQHGQLGLFGVIMPGVAQVAPTYNLFFTTGLMVSLAGASAPALLEGGDGEDPAPDLLAVSG
jgi:hypothetical protein